MQASDYQHYHYHSHSTSFFQIPVIIELQKVYTMGAFQRPQPWCFNPRFQCQLGHVTLGHAFVLAVCIFVLPMAVVAVEHVQLASTEPVSLFGRGCVHPHHIFKHNPLMLPSLNNILPAMALQNEIVKSNIWCLSHSSSYAGVCHVSSSQGFKDSGRGQG